MDSQSPEPLEGQDLLDRLEQDGIEHLWVIYHDYSGRSCAKTVPPECFENAVRHGVVFARANVDFNVEDHQTPDAVFLAETGDFMAVPDPDSYAVVPYRPATARVHAWMRGDDGSVWEGCPRTMLQRMVERYAQEGFSLQVGYEPEFYLFERHADGYRPANADRMFTVAGLNRHADLWEHVITTLRQMGVTVEQLGKEYGAAQYELTARHARPLKAVDDYLTIKEVIRALAHEAGWVASFMPKPFQHLAGCGLHIHLSLWDAAGERDLSIGETADEPLSRPGRHFLGGLLAHAHGLTGLGAPIVNSYKRLLPGSWAPAHVCWGVGNRAALVRIPAMGRRRHIEFRSGDNAAQPFIYLTAIMAAGLDGIRNQIEPPPPIQEDIGHWTAEEARARGVAFLPRTLPEALAALEADEVIAEALGPVILPTFLRVKRSELETYQLHVTQWERDAYLEVI